MKFLPYQKDWINDNSRLKILEKSRRIGGTFATSYRVFLDLLMHKGHDIVVITRDESLATEFVNNVTNYAKMWNAIRPQDAFPEKNFKRLSLEIPHNSGASRLIAVSSNPNASAGKGGSLIIDELALHKDPELLMRVAQPIITTGGNLAVLSTHRSRNSLFNGLVKEAKVPGQTKWSLHSTTIYQAVEQGFVEQVVNPNMIRLGHPPYPTRQAFIDWLKSTYDEHTFLQEFCCVPSDDACSLLSSIEVDNSISKFNSAGSLDKGITFLGWDVAESLDGDYAALCVIRAYKKEVELIEPYYFPLGTKIDDQLDTIVAYAKKYKVQKVISDNAGLGRHPTTVLKKRLGESRVVEFNPTMQSKGEMCTKVKRYFQNDRVRMMKNKMVEDDFLSIDRVITPSGNIVYNAVRSGHVHGDMFSAFGMAMTEVPEEQSGEIKGVSSPTEVFEKSLEEYNGSPRTSQERELLNREQDRQEESSLTY